MIGDIIELLMEHIHLVEYTIYISFFLLTTSLVYILSKKISFPYTVSLLIAGFIGQLIVHFFHLDLHLSLSPDFTYFVLLPILLFEASLGINIHQFKLQFRTITFLATFGLLLSIFTVAFGAALLLQLPFEIALLFGAIISATDPIAVLALFKTLGAPKRLALVADGESMFNDATAVIAFRVISGFVLAEQAFRAQTFLQTFNNFMYVFIGSILLGVLLGYLFSVVVKRIKTEKVFNAALITALALGSFSAAEHFFHLSGVITSVMAGIAFGNLARGRMNRTVFGFVEEFFGYLGFLALSLVFYFASFSLDFGLFTSSIPTLLVVVLIVLIARAVSVYGTVFLSNRLPLFKNEPNIPMSWQHILNWGGLRGVIPLVLVYSLPDTFEYKQMMLQFTFAALLFTLFVNGLTIKPLLLKLKLHLPKKEEKIIEDELKMFEIDVLRTRLQMLPEWEFNPKIVASMDKELKEKEDVYKKEIVQIADEKTFLTSLKLEALTIEREILHKLFEQGRFTERVLHEFESELDLQQDALEYPNLYQTHIVNKKGEITSRKAFRKKLIVFRRFIAQYALLSKLLHINEKDIVLERYALCRARLFTSLAVIDYLDRLERKFAKHKTIKNDIDEVRKVQSAYIERNQQELDDIEKEYPDYVTAYQKKMISRIITAI
jgi:monovalent cation:H+ antiporter, CPA1 family